MQKLLKVLCCLSVILLSNVAAAGVYRCDIQGKVSFSDDRFACAGASRARLSYDKPRTERKIIAAIPDLSQRDPRAQFPDDGRQYCAPVAVSNSISSALGGLSSRQQIELARTLGSADYMSTNAKGTNPMQLLKGVDHYLTEQSFTSYGSNSLEYRGQNPVSRKYNPTLDRQVELPWLISGIKQEKHIWLNIGWYKTEANGDKKRVGGHWVTLVGYEKLGDLKDGEGEYLMINDPATRGGEQQEKVTLKYSQLNGRIGYQLLNQRSKPKNADTAWVEGAIQLAL